MSSYYVIVASRDHVLTAKEGGFIQAGHGKKRPLKRLSVGDGIVCYSPRMRYGEQKKCQRFTALGYVSGDAVYQVQMAPDFEPYRVGVEFELCQEVDIRLLLDELSFVTNRQRWGMHFRYGLFEIPKEDFELIWGRMAP